MGRRTKRALPGGQAEVFGYDFAGSEIAHTNFNGLVITNALDPMNRLKSKWNAGTQLEGEGVGPIIVTSWLVGSLQTSAGGSVSGRSCFGLFAKNR